MEDMPQEIATLIEKAAKTDDAGDALRFSQAASNAASAMCAAQNYKMAKAEEDRMK